MRGYHGQFTLVFKNKRMKAVVKNMIWRQTYPSLIAYSCMAQYVSELYMQGRKWLAVIYPLSDAGRVSPTKKSDRSPILGCCDR